MPPSLAGTVLEMKFKIPSAQSPKMSRLRILVTLLSILRKEEKGRLQIQFTLREERLGALKLSSGIALV